MQVEQLYTNCLAQATYYIEDSGEVAIIDPLRDVDDYIAKAKANGHTIKYIFETHFHADFVSGHIDLAQKTGAPIIFGPGAETSFECIQAKDMQRFDLGNVSIEVRHTPGHTPESSTYVLFDEKNQPHAAFTGDTLFVGDVGRPDLLVGSEEYTSEKLAGMLYDSLHNQLLNLPDSTLIYPAHGPGSACGKNLGSETFSTLGEQKTSNYALQAENKTDFIQVVTEGISAPPAYFFEDALLNKKGYKTLDTIVASGQKKHSITSFKEEMENGALVIDTRNALTFENGFIKGSIFIGLEGQYAIWAANLFPLDRKILLVTEPGKEMESVVRLTRVGFENIVGYLDGGFDAWQNAGEEIDLLISVTPEEFTIDLKHGKEAVALDVRKQTEFDDGHIEKAQWFTLAEIPEKQLDLDPEKDYYIYCAGGYRSVIAASLLKAQNMQRVRSVYGGYNAIIEYQS